MDKNQTAVEWLREQWHKVPQSQFGNLFEQAKAMEKQQIIDARASAPINPIPHKNYIIEAEHYYNETYATEGGEG